MAYVTGAFSFGGYSPPPDDEALWPCPSDPASMEHPPSNVVSDYFLGGAGLLDSLTPAAAAPSWPMGDPSLHHFPDLNGAPSLSCKLSHLDSPPFASLPGHRSSNASSSSSSVNGSSSCSLPSNNPSPQSTTGAAAPTEQSPPSYSALSLAMPFSPFGTDSFVMTNTSLPATAPPFSSACYVQDTKLPPHALLATTNQLVYPFPPSYIPVATNSSQSSTLAAPFPQPLASANPAAGGIPSVTIPDLNSRALDEYSRRDNDPGFAVNQCRRLAQPGEGALDNIAMSRDLLSSKDEMLGHNAVEKRYRNNINNNIAALADLVPALSHLRALPSAATSRRHSSQFIVSSSAIGKIPTGLVDGVKAAQKLSKGSILSKSVDYIRHLRRTRDEMTEDVEDLKFLIKSMVQGGDTIIKQWEERVRTRSPAREKARLVEQQAGAEDGDDDDDDGGRANKPPLSKKRKASDPKPAVSQAGTYQTRLAVGTQQQAASVTCNVFGYQDLLGSGVGDLASGLDFDPTRYTSLQNMPSVGGFLPMANGPSPGSGSSHQGTPPTVPSYLHQAAQRRQLLAAFMGLTFATGTGLHYRSRRTPKAKQSSWLARPISTLKHTQVHQLRLGHAQVGFNIIGLIAILILGILLTRPNLLLHRNRAAHFAKKLSKSMVTPKRPFKAMKSPPETFDEYDDESVSDLLGYAASARERLINLAGGPEGALRESLGLAREVTLTIYRKAQGVCRPSGSDMLEGNHQASIEATEQALTWLRIAEIEVALGPSQTSAVSRLHTALRLYNLSRSAEWPHGASSPAQASFPKVNAVLSLHLRTLLGDTNSVSEALWVQAMNRMKQSDASLEPWVGEALSANFDEACRLVDQKGLSNGISTPSDTLPLLKIAEFRSEEALLELWSRIWVQTIRRTCPLADDMPLDVKQGTLQDLRTQTEEISDGLALQVSAARAVMEEAVNHIFSKTLPGSTIRTLACVTKGVWALGFGAPHAAFTCADILAHEATEGYGPASRLACLRAFMELIFGKGRSDVILGPGQSCTPVSAVDKLATATISWLSLRRKHYILQRPCAGGVQEEWKTADDLQLSAIHLKQLLKDEIFLSEDVIQSSTKQTREAVDAGEAKEYDLGDAVKDCLGGLEQILDTSAKLGGAPPSSRLQPLEKQKL